MNYIRKSTISLATQAYRSTSLTTTCTHLPAATLCTTPGQHPAAFPAAAEPAPEPEAKPTDPEPGAPPAPWWAKFTSIVPALTPEQEAEKSRKHRILVTRMRRSKIADAMRMESEKLWIADASLIPLAQTRPFPRMAVDSLYDDKSMTLPDALRGKVTLVSLSFNGVGKQQVDKFARAFQQAFNLRAPGEGVAGMNMIDIHYMDGMVYSMLRGPLANGLKTTTDPDLAPFATVKFQPYVPHTEDLLDELDVHNRAMGHVYITDTAGVIRWRAHQEPNASELESMITAASQLLEEAFPVKQRARGGRR